MITITLKIQIIERDSPKAKVFKPIELDGNTYLNKFARVSNETEILSVAIGSQCLGIVMEEAKYISLYYRTYPNGNIYNIVCN